MFNEVCTDHALTALPNVCPYTERQHMPNCELSASTGVNVCVGGDCLLYIYIHVIMHLTENGSVIEEYIIFMMPL